MQGYQELFSFPDTRYETVLCTQVTEEQYLPPQPPAELEGEPRCPNSWGQPLMAKTQDKMTPVRWSKDKSLLEDVSAEMDEKIN